MKILLFTTSPLDDKSSAWQLLKKMISCITGHEIIIFSSNHLINAQKKFQNYGVIHYHLLLYNPVIRKIINKIWKKFHYYIALFYSNILSKKISQIIVMKSIDKIWIYNDMLTVLTVSKLLEKTIIPYHVSIFDDILHNIDYKVYGVRLEKEYIKVLKNSTSIDVIVPEQKMFYVDNKIIEPFQPVAISYGGIFKRSESEKFEVRESIKKICLTGNIFGLKSFLIFCSAVENVCRNERIEIHIYANNEKLTKLSIKKSLAKYSKFVSLKPFVAEKDIIHTITKYDLAYMQVSFNEEDKHKAITSFPSKTHNYLSSTIPILLHSPDYATISKFLRGNNLCYSINTIKQNEIELAFKEILNSKIRSSIHENIIEFNNEPNNNLHFEKLVEIIATT